MKVSVETLENSQAKLTIELSVEEVAPYLEKAVKRIGKEVSIKGFRKGHVPVDVLKQHVGESSIYEEAFSDIVEKTYPEAVDQEKLHVVGRANIDMEKLAPGNPIVYTATVPLMPKVVLGDYKTIKTKKATPKMDDKKYEKTIEDLRRMRAKEVLVDRAAKDGDAVIIDFDVKVDGVSIEGGQGTKARLVLGSGQFIPGFEDGVVGMKTGETKTVDAQFPDEYHQASLAGKAAKADVTLHEVYEITLPELNEELAKELNFESVELLEKEIRENIMKELEEEAEREFEIAAIGELVKMSTIDPLPEQLVAEETDKMLAELKYDMMQRGMKFEDYLTHLKKTEDELREEFTTRASERIEAALVVRELAVAEKIEVTNEDIEKELAETLKIYEQYPDALSQIDTPAYRERMQNILMNKKTFERLNSFTK